VHDFADRIRGTIDQLDPAQKQQLLRLLIEDVRLADTVQSRNLHHS
jgi:hypothetical protein